MDYCDGDEFKRHPLFSSQPHAIQIIMYYDDVEICNPLGSRRTKHKLGKNVYYIHFYVQLYSSIFYRYLLLHDWEYFAQI